MNERLRFDNPTSHTFFEGTNHRRVFLKSMKKYGDWVGYDINPATQHRSELVRLDNGCTITVHESRIDFNAIENR